MTDLVAFPEEASMTRPSALPSETSRFIGAASGETTDIIRSADIKLPYPIFISFMTLLYILYLFADLLKLRLHIDDSMRYLCVRTFRTDRIGLAIHFLKEKIKLSSHRLV